MYEQYLRVHWIDEGAVRGFAEWPYGRAGREDLDSGPILFGVGATATTFGISAAIAMNDSPRVGQLEAQAAHIRMLLSSGLLQAMLDQDNRALRLDPSFVTGFLYGDATLFYALSWIRPSTRSLPSTAQASGPIERL